MYRQPYLLFLQMSSWDSVHSMILPRFMRKTPFKSTEYTLAPSLAIIAVCVRRERKRKGGKGGRRREAEKEGGRERARAGARRGGGGGRPSSLI